MIAVLSQRSLKYGFRAYLKILGRLGGSSARSQYYFGYGANLCERRLIEKGLNVEFVSGAYAPGYVLKFNVACEYVGQGYAGIVKARNQKAFGALYRVDTKSLVLLDIMEWVPFSFYTREQVVVVGCDGTEYSAWAYIPSHPRSNLIPSKKYLNFMISLSRDIGLPEGYIAELTKTQSQDSFPIDHSFSLLNAGKRRFGVRMFGKLYAIHDAIREKIASKLP